MKKFISLLFLICFVAIGVSCAVMKFDINFVVDGESYASVSTSGKETISLPGDPEKEGYTFKGWYWDDGVWEKPFTANSLLNTSLTNNMVVYAYFVKNNADNETVTLEFNTMGGSAIEKQIIAKGSMGAEPKAPTLDGYFFCGWYKYPDYQDAFSFEQAITSNLTLYAKWVQEGNSSLAINDFEDMVKVEQGNSFYDIFKNEETGRIYVVYKLGKMHNVILGRVSNRAAYNAGGTTLTWENTTGWEQSVTNSVENSLACAITVSVEVETGVEAFGASLSVNSGFSETIEASTAYSYGTTRSIMSQASSGGSQLLDSFERGRYYDMFVVGSQNVYQYFVYDPTGKYEGTAITSAEISSGLMPLSSENAVFKYENIPALTPMEAPDFSMIFDSGNGTSDSPYFISTPAQFFAVGLCPNANYKLANDIDLSIFKEWNPLCSSEETAFWGVFDGCGNTIRNLGQNYTGSKLNSDKAYGIFGRVCGEIKNLNLNNISMEITPQHDGDGWIHLGLLCGNLGGTVSNIHAEECSAIVHRDKSDVGIIVGHSTGTIRNSSVKCSNIFSNGSTGLIVGAIINGSACDNSVYQSSLSYYAANANRSCGGIVGYVQSSTIDKCNVENTKFILAGSDGSLHSYNTIGGHHCCKLQPVMGYIIGISITSNVNVDNLWETGNAIEYKSDEAFVGNTSKNESKCWFRHYDGKIGAIG